MKVENYEVLKEMLIELQHEYEIVQKRINANLLYIEESNAYLKSVLEEDEIERVRVEIHFYEKENSNLSTSAKKLNSKIKRIEQILKDDEDSNVKVFDVLEEERHRISKDMHDTSLQNLAHLVHKVELSSMYIDKDPERAKRELASVNKSLKLVIEEIRNTIYNLRPMEFDDLGLKAAFERLMSIINVDKKYDIDFYVQDVSCENSIVLLTLYRAVQECLNNIIKHAQATKIIFHASYNEGVYSILIKDNGKGFHWEEVEKKKNNHFGLYLIYERVTALNGEVNIIPSSKGTRVEINIPIKNDLIIR